MNVNNNELIRYDKIDGGDSLKFSLGNRDKIKYSVLSVYNQDGTTIRICRIILYMFNLLLGKKWKK